MGRKVALNKVYLILITIFFIYIFLVLNPEFKGPDQPIYYSYTASVVEDGDLNAVNHIDEHYPYFLPSGKIGVSITYNLPDHHNHGGVVLWVPFYIYGKSMYFLIHKVYSNLEKKYNQQQFIHCSLSLSTLIFYILVCLSIYFVSRIKFSFQAIFLSLFVIFWGTPFFYYTLVEPGNANIIATLFSTLLILFSTRLKNLKKTHWFLYGMFFSICMVIKVDLWFYVIFILFIWYVDTSGRFKLSSLGYFISGFLPVFILRGINDYLKYGYFHSGELGLINLKDCYLWEQLFSSYRGFFYTSPIFYITIGGFLLVVHFYLRKKDRKIAPGFEKMLIFLWLMVIFKILVLSKRYAWGGGTCGARPLLTEYPVFVLTYAYLWKKLNNHYLRFFLILISIVCVMWNFLVISEYMSGADIENLGKHISILHRIDNIKEIIKYLMMPKDLGLKLWLCMPLVLITFFVVLGIKNKISTLKVFNWFTTYLVLIYFVITTLNVVNNKNKVERLKREGFFDNCEVLKPGEYEKIENLGSMDEMIEYFSRIGDLKRAEKIKKLKKELYGQ